MFDGPSELRSATLGLLERLLRTGTKRANGVSFGVELGSRRQRPDEADRLAAHDPARYVQRTGNVDVEFGTWWTHARLGDSALVVDLQSRRGYANLASDFWSATLYEQRVFWLLPLLVILRSIEEYALHGNAVVDPESSTGILILGASGSGKTTLAISLALQRFGFLSDDTLLLAREDAAIQARDGRRGFTLTRETIGAFPTLRNAEFLYPVHDKGVYDVETLFPHQHQTSITPDVILFPSIATSATSRIEGIDRIEGLFTLSEHAIGFLQDEVWGPKQLAFLRDLSEQVRFYRFHAGRDVMDSPERVVDIVRMA